MKNFIYDSTCHKGYYKGVEVPSITQLLETEYPMGSISEEVLKKASERGTEVHEDIELYNRGIKDSCDTKEGRNCVALTKSLGLEPYAIEKEVYVRNEKGDIIAYGHLDCIYRASKYICLENKKLVLKEQLEGKEVVLVRQHALVLCDYKTVYQFDCVKVQKQTNMYRLGVNADLEEDIENLIGIWVRDDIAEVKLLNVENDQDTKDRINKYIELWKEQQNG